MRILGVGLSRTGTLSLSMALEALGYRTLHWCPERLRDVVMGTTENPDFRRYDDVDAVTDLPAALFYRELLEAYPGTRCILTRRPEDDWFRSVKHHYEVAVPTDLGSRPEMMEEARRTQELAYGSAQVVPFLYRKRYRDHNHAVERDVPADQLLIIDVTRDLSWTPLCTFLGVPEPHQPFPHANRSSRQSEAEPPAGLRSKLASYARSVLARP